MVYILFKNHCVAQVEVITVILLSMLSSNLINFPNKMHKLSLKQPWRSGSVGWTIVPVHQGYGFHPGSYTGINQRVQGWAEQQIDLSLSNQ